MKNDVRLEIADRAIAAFPGCQVRAIKTDLMHPNEFIVTLQMNDGFKVFRATGEKFVEDQCNLRPEGSNINLTIERD